VSAAFKFRRQENSNHGLCQNFGNEAGRQGNDIGIIVLTGEHGYFFRPAQGASDALVFVGRHGYSISCAAQQYAAVGLLGGDGFCHGMCKVRIINGFCGIGTKIEYHMPLCLQHRYDAVFKRKSGMIAANCYLHEYEFVKVVRVNN